MERVRNEVTCRPLSPSRSHLQLLIRQAEHLVVFVHLLILDPHMDTAEQEVSVAISQSACLLIIDGGGRWSPMSDSCHTFWSASRRLCSALSTLPSAISTCAALLTAKAL